MPVLSETEIDEFERSINARLPTLYRSLLQEVGAGKYGGHSEIYHPDEIYALFEQFFDAPEQIFQPYYPFGGDDLDQVVWVIDARTERAATIWHETVPDDWPEEEWLPYDEWRRNYLGATNGNSE